MSPHYDDILMWGYYGGFGSGLCGGFKKVDIVDAFKEESNFILVSGKVFYSKDNNFTPLLGFSPLKIGFSLLILQRITFFMQAIFFAIHLR